MLPKVAIVYLSFHCEPYINDVVSALRNITYPKDRLELVIVDNPHPQFGSSVPFINEEVMKLSGNELPHITVLPQETNLGFAEGNNVGMRWAIEQGFDYVYLHNNDGFVAANFLEPLVDAMEADKTIGTAQSLMLLYPETDLINSAGNSFQYLGMGFCNHIREKKDEVKMDKIVETPYASGAALMMRASLLKDNGLMDKDFFLYHEDVEYCLRLRSLGYRVVVVTDSIFYHKYTFGRNKEKFYFIERNRLGVLLMYYKWQTLLLLSPMFLTFELGILLFSWKKGWFLEKIRSYKYWLKKESWNLWLKKRENIQKNRKVSDKDFMKSFVSEITFDDVNIKNVVLDYIGNPLMRLYWAVAYNLMSW